MAKLNNNNDNLSLMLDKAWFTEHLLQNLPIFQNLLDFRIMQLNYDPFKKDYSCFDNLEAEAKEDAIKFWNIICQNKIYPDEGPRNKLTLLIDLFNHVAISKSGQKSQDSIKTTEDSAIESLEEAINAEAFNEFKEFHKWSNILIENNYISTKIADKLLETLTKQNSDVSTITLQHAIKIITHFIDRQEVAGDNPEKKNEIFKQLLDLINTHRDEKLQIFCFQSLQKLMGDAIEPDNLLKATTLILQPSEGQTQTFILDTKFKEDAANLLQAIFKEEDSREISLNTIPSSPSCISKSDESDALDDNNWIVSSNAIDLSFEIIEPLLNNSSAKTLTLVLIAQKDLGCFDDKVKEAFNIILNCAKGIKPQYAQTALTLIVKELQVAGEMDAIVQGFKIIVEASKEETANEEVKKLAKIALSSALVHLTSIKHINSIADDAWGFITDNNRNDLIGDLLFALKGSDKFDAIKTQALNKIRDDGEIDTKFKATAKALYGVIIKLDNSSELNDIKIELSQIIDNWSENTSLASSPIKIMPKLEAFSKQVKETALLQKFLTKNNLTEAFGLEMEQPTPGPESNREAEEISNEPAQNTPANDLTDDIQLLFEKLSLNNDIEELANNIAENANLEKLFEKIQSNLRYDKTPPTPNLKKLVKSIHSRLDTLPDNINKLLDNTEELINALDDTNTEHFIEGLDDIPNIPKGNYTAPLYLCLSIILCCHKFTETQEDKEFEALWLNTDSPIRNQPMARTESGSFDANRITPPPPSPPGETAFYYAYRNKLVDVYNAGGVVDTPLVKNNKQGKTGCLGTTLQTIGEGAMYGTIFLGIGLCCSYHNEYRQGAKTKKLLKFAKEGIAQMTAIVELSGVILMQIIVKKSIVTDKESSWYNYFSANSDNDQEREETLGSKYGKKIAKIVAKGMFNETIQSKTTQGQSDESYEEGNKKTAREIVHFVFEDLGYSEELVQSLMKKVNEHLGLDPNEQDGEERNYEIQPNDDIQPEEREDESEESDCNPLNAGRLDSASTHSYNMSNIVKNAFVGNISASIDSAPPPSHNISRSLFVRNSASYDEKYKEGEAFCSGETYTEEAL